MATIAEKKLNIINREVNMLKIVVEKWWKNKKKLEDAYRTKKGWNFCSYLDIVKETIDTILNDEGNQWDIKHITEIDNGDYQGTYLYLIPANTYQPGADEYLMTYVYYGSCSGCDTLQAIQEGWSEVLKEDQIKEFMMLSLHLLENMIKPYNDGWRSNDDYKQVQDGWKF
jgi:hypothetical protein